MPEESNQIIENQTANQRNVANNSKNIRAVADMASKTSNPYAKTAGLAVKTADKISGGKASEKLGKTLNTLNKMNGLKGRMMQSALNKMGESGTTNRISNAINKKNFLGNSLKMGNVFGNSSQHTMTSVKDKNEGESSDSATATFSGNFKVVKWGLIALAAIFPIIFCCLFISSSQVFLNTISLGTADSLSGEEVDKKINKKMKDNPEDFDQEIKDEDLENDTAFNYDVYINDSKSQILKNNKLYNSNIVQVADIFTVFKRKYNEATLDRIEEFFPMAAEESKNYDKENHLVYDFYFKMYNLYISYKNKYNVNLDLPLLMATLNVQSSDKSVIFSSNMDSRYRTDNENDIPKNELDYYYDWNSNYKISRDNSEHDMEILAQNMVSKQVKEMCIDSSGKPVVGKEKTLKDDEIGIQTLFCAEGETYETKDLGYLIDNDKYNEFLKEFLEKKYYLPGEHDIKVPNSNSNSGNNNEQDNNENSEIGSDGKVACALTIIGNKYYRTVNPATKSCNVPGFYDNNSWGLEPKFYKNILDLIKYAKSQGCDAKIISGHRTYEKQSYFYDCFISKKCNNGNQAAKPGNSNHEYGIAADLRYLPDNPYCLNVYHSNAQNFGLEYPLLNAEYPEDWHIEPINIIKGTP